MTRTLPRPALGALVAAGLTAGAAHPAAAQARGAAPATASCDVDQNKPGALGLAFLDISRAQSLPDTGAKFKALRGAVGRATSDAGVAKSNPTGTAYTVGQALAMMSTDLHLANAATRADLGFTSNPTAPADLLKLVDSSLTVVETAKPNCAAQTGQLREYAWLTTTNAALQALNTKPDSAAKLAERGMIVFKKSPLSYYVLATAAQNGGNAADAKKYWPEVARLAEGDTAQQSRELRSAALQNVAVLASQAADAAPAADKPARATEAATAIRAFLAAYPNSPDAPRLQGQLARMITATGDKGAVSAVYADQLANPAKYDDLALTNAGVIASQAGNKDDAAKLFAAALQKNPNQRDALNNLTATYYQQQKWTDIIPVAQRLVAVDPSNPDNYLFLAFAYQGLAKATTAPAQKKLLTDSLIKYNQLSTDTPVKVTFTEFTRGASRSVLSMKVEARKPDAGSTSSAGGASRAGARGAARPATAATSAGPKTYTVSVEFLDLSGAVVDTQQVSVGPLAPGDSKAARVESPKGGVAAFRYKLAG